MRDNKENRFYRIDEGSNFELMRQKKRADDDLRNIPAPKSQLSKLESLKLFVGKGDRVLRKIDKESPETFMAAKYIELREGTRALVLGSQEGFVGIAIAATNPNSKVYLYDSDMAMARLSARNLQANYHIQNVHIVDNNEVTQLAKDGLDVIVYNPKRFTAMNLVEETITFGISMLRQGGEFFLVASKKSGSERQIVILEGSLGTKVEIIARGKGGYRVIKGIKSLDGQEQAVRDFRQTVSFQIFGKNFEVETEASLFSKDNLDVGTRVLLESVELNSFKRLLDLGCGWGAVGLVAASVNPNSNVVMTDVDSRAVKVAQGNVQKLGLQDRVEILATDDIRTIPGNFDFILSNPPFHANTQTLVGIFEGSRDKLAKNGKLYLVVEKTYLNKLQDVLERAFGHSTIYHEDLKTGFYVLSARK